MFKPTLAKTLAKTTVTTMLAPRQTLPAVLLALALGTAGSAVAQAQQGGQGQSGGYAPPQEQGGEVSDEKLGQFMVAMASVQDVQEEYAGQIQSTSDGEKAQELRQEAQSKMISAVEDSGLSVPQYNMIAERMRTDPDLAERAGEME